MSKNKRSAIQLVKEVKEGEVVTETYLSPLFIPLSVTYEALDLAKTIDDKDMGEREKTEKLVHFIANTLYKKQFTVDELINGLHGPEALETLYEQLVFATNGYQSDETKKFLAKKR